jgi:hypothetical protein
MSARGRSRILSVSAGVFAVGLLSAVCPAPASAQGIFERIFGGILHAAPARQLPSSASSFADPFATMRENSAPRAASGPASAYCVRTSDGFYFPVQAHAGVSAAEACHAVCPASQTRLYSGSGIDHAVASDGGRYTDLDTAFLYRKELVAGSTCNGRGPFGLARVDVATDPTLRPGDIVATRTGLVAVTAMKNKVADFAPFGSDRGVAKSTREKLAGVKIMPTARGAAPVTLSSRVRTDENRSAQLSR